MIFQNLPEYGVSVPSGSSATTHDVTSPFFNDFTVGQPLWLDFIYEATRQSGTDTANLRSALLWYDAAGNSISSTTYADITINATIGKTFVEYKFVPPAGAVKGACRFTVTSAVSPMEHDISIFKVRLGKTQRGATFGADWSATITNRPTNLSNLTGSEAIQNTQISITSGSLNGIGTGNGTTVGNSLISIGANGALAGAGGGQVTYDGLGGGAYGDANRVRWSRFEQGVKGWTAVEQSGGLVESITTTTENGKPAVQLTVSFTAASQYCIFGTDISQALYPVTAGERVFASALIASDSAIGAAGSYAFFIGWIDSTGAEFGSRTIVQQALGGVAAGTRIGGFATVPAGAVACFFRLGLYTNSGTGARTGVLTVAEPLLCSAGANQTAWPNFTPGPGTEPGATAGATWGGNITSRPTNLANLIGSENILNSGISIGSNGALSGAGGGQVTIGGLGYLGDLQANASTTGNELFDDTFASGFWNNAPGGGNNVVRMAPTAGYSFVAGYAHWCLNWDVPPSTATPSEVNTYAKPTPVEPGRVYQAGVWIQSNVAPSSTTVVFGIRWYDANMGMISNSTPSATLSALGITGGATPKLVRTSAKAPSNAAFAIFVIEVVPMAGNTGTVRFERPFLNHVEPSGVSTPGSGVRVGDGRNIPAIVSAGTRYYYNQSPTYTASAGSPATATITLPAGLLTIGSQTISYNAMTVGVTGTGGTSGTYNLYVDDPSYSGGTQTLNATTSTSIPYQNDGRIYMGQISVTFPSSGTSSGSGTGGGGGGLTCVWDEAWIPTLRGYVRARDIQVGDWILVVSEGMSGTRYECVTHASTHESDGWEIMTRDGRAMVPVSEETPLTMRDGSTIMPCQLAGEQLATQIDGEFDWLPCFAQPMGKKISVRLISVSNCTYAAGVEQDKLIFTHNKIAQQP